jgi:hypothetical protein
MRRFCQRAAYDEFMFGDPGKKLLLIGKALCL